MNSKSNANSQTRYVALDVHKYYVMVGGLNAEYEVVLRPRRVSSSRFATWAAKHLRPSDEVVIEATTNTWTIYDIVAPKELARLSNTEPWASQTPFVMQIPGFGLIVTMTALAAIGDIGRFCVDKKLVGYSGLHPSVHQSGEIHRHGRITKEGRKDLRWAAVEAAWAAVRSNAYWKSEFKRLKKRMHANQAIVAIARRLLVALWHVLTKKEPYRLSSQEQKVRKMLRWSWCMGDQALDGLTRQQFIRYALMRLDVDYEGPTIEHGGYPRRIASAEEVLAICPELSPPD